MFFSEAFEGDQDGVGVAEDAPDGGRGNETREAVEVAELAEVGHARIVTTFASAEKSKTALETGRFQGIRGSKLPTRIHEEPKN